MKKTKNKLDHKKGAGVVAYDACAQALGLTPWRKAKVIKHLFEDDAWWYEVKFADGGRCSILKPAGVREAE